MMSGQDAVGQERSFHEANARPIERGGRATDRGGVQSVTVAARILNALARAGGSVALKTLAAETGLARAKVHRYLRSLRTAGLVSQQPDTSLYQLGPQAIAIGLAALRGVNPVAEVCNALPALRDNINQTVTAAVWSEAGPILVAMQESDHWLTMNIRIGSRLPVLTTAIGRIFLAYLPEARCGGACRCRTQGSASSRNRITLPGGACTISPARFAEGGWRGYQARSFLASMHSPRRYSTSPTNSSRSFASSHGRKPRSPAGTEAPCGRSPRPRPQMSARLGFVDGAASIDETNQTATDLRQSSKVL